MPLWICFSERRSEAFCVVLLLWEFFKWSYKRWALFPLQHSLSFSPHFLQVGNHIDVVTAKWVAQDAGIGAGVDSYFEYLVKGAILLQDKELMSMFLGKQGCLFFLTVEGSQECALDFTCKSYPVGE